MPFIIYLWYARLIIIGRLPSYIEVVKNIFKGSKYIIDEDFDDDISNNLIKSFNKTFK
ncbi:MAG: hypothetical protein E6902_07780 [Paeniclostridium sordellii]|nr:hypothetical protein [Paeniclostridium sordellii]